MASDAIYNVTRGTVKPWKHTAMGLGFAFLGNFQIELAFYGAVGTFINESGIELILTEADILAEGSMMGFI